MSGPSTTDVLKQQLGLTDQQLSDAEERSAKDGVSFMHALELLKIVPEDKLLDVFSKIHKRPKTNLGAKDNCLLQRVKRPVVSVPHSSLY